VSSTASADHYTRSQGPQSFSGSSDASLSAFLARDPDILALRGLTLGSPGDSELRYRPTAGQMTAFESDSGDDDDYQGAMRMQKLQAAAAGGAGYRDSGRQSTATTVTMNEGSNHSQFHFANMTADEARAAAAIVSAAARTGGVASASSDRPPFAPDASRSSNKSSASASSSSKIMYFGSSRPAARAAGGDSPSMRSVSSGASKGNDMIHLGNGKDFVVFSEPRQTEVLRRVDSSKDMIPLQL
jgi:hypothetical protein